MTAPIVSFNQPSGEELDHTFPWRVAKVVPERGQEARRLLEAGPEG